jgi:hypothetical protein
MIRKKQPATEMRPRARSMKHADAAIRRRRAAMWSNTVQRRPWRRRPDRWWGSRPSTVSGVVYENRSGGAQRAAGVVKTDAAGRYALPADEESIVRDKGERE